MKNIKEYLVPTVILFVICFIAAVLLGLTNNITAPTIAANDEATRQEAMKTVLPDAASFGESKDEESSGCSFSEAFDASGNIIGYAVTSIGKGGYNGDIKLMIGLDAEGKVREISFLSIDETPSIGMKLKTNLEFLNQFVGLSGSAALSNKGGSVDAVTGATKTSTGITDAVNNALICFSNIKEVA